MRRLSLLALTAVLATVVPVGASAQSVPAIPYTAVPDRTSDPVVLTGASFPSWAVPADQTAAAPSLEGLQCLGEDSGFPAGLFPDSPLTDDEPCSHNEYDEPLVSTQSIAGLSGSPTNRLLGYRWNAASASFEQIPFQVDEMFTRYISNDISGFAAYSERDQHSSYAFDREGFRWTASDPSDPCLAAPASEIAPDPVPGLDTDDELVFMARDAGPKAPASANLPAGILDVYEVTVADPFSQGQTSFVYVARADEGGPAPAFDATNGYVRYERDADANVFLFSESSYDNYGNAPHGPWYDPATGTCYSDPADYRQHRPGDQATITTPRYRFRYDGRWLMTELNVSDHPDGDWTYGADMVDQWKARAFQQRPGGETPCCGFEEEVNNWGGSSILMGERSGPVRTIRETWGADSGTNVVRREIFYRDEIRLAVFLRVHVIPPLDGIYTQWDHTAGAVTRYYNPFVPDGAPIDGKNDEVFGNSRIAISPTGISYEGDDTLSDMLEEAAGGTPIVVGDPSGAVVDNDIDSPDPTFSGVNGLLAWEQIEGPAGTLVSRWQSKQITPGGVAHTPFAVPYYRDDACFDDGTGSDPGPHLRGRRTDDGQYALWTDADGATRDRECWDADTHASDPDYAADLGSRRFFQGSIGTHGMHLLLIADSDNAGTTLPLTEIDVEQRMVVLPPQGRNVGESYGRGFEKPLLAGAAPVTFAGGAAANGQWVAGDLHIHTTYSHDALGVQFDEDGNPAPDDEIDPAEVYTVGNTVAEQFAMAAARGLDFLAITDHNDVRSQSDPGWEVGGVLGLPGYENSLSGHAQMLGATDLYDKGDLDGDGDNDADDVNLLADALRANGGVFQQNHPTSDWVSREDPTTAAGHEHLDWGYGYDVVPDTLEVWSIAPYWQPPAPSASSLDDALRYWDGYLDRGHRVAATGGSDNHYKATLPVQGPGQPTTWVFVDDVSVEGVLAGLRDGRTFVSVQPPAHQGPQVFLQADGDGDGEFESMVGDTVAPGSAFRARVVNAPGTTLRAIADGGALVAEVAIVGPDETMALDIPADATRVRTELVAEDLQDARETVCDEALGDQTTYCRNRLALLSLSSPIYVRGDVASTALTVTAPPSGQHTDIVEVAATLTSGGVPVAGEDVRFTVGAQSATATTDANGDATAALTLADAPGEYTVTAAFGGTDTLLRSQATAPLTITREATVLTYTGHATAGPKDVRLAATLAEDDGPALAGRTVTFDLDGATYEAVTDEAGQAQVVVDSTTKGQAQTVTVTYAGDDRFDGASTSATIAWKPGGGKGGGAFAAMTPARIAAAATAGSLILLWLILAAAAALVRARRPAPSDVS